MKPTGGSLRYMMEFGSRPTDKKVGHIPIQYYIVGFSNWVHAWYFGGDLHIISMLGYGTLSDC
ncbi:hypothetical protein CFOL_v3_16033 [Cephalotus follicularis]|uniref:Uncharacterized protein n=1 Tax=Cephalotus follicularis TaxID=3775 RepID=A0A1Q3BX26_CEPFO|nr:hypothetical protein CFOL_v3_16033 [Cephalotus follicularis]